jgi:hypothetical protein
MACADDNTPMHLPPPPPSCRLGYSMHSFLSKGTVPSIEEANHSEPLLPGVGFNAVSEALALDVKVVVHSMYM